MTTRDIIADIKALLDGHISGPEQVRGVLKKARDALAALDGGEAVPEGACPVCGCEERNSRDLWTCECPAHPPRSEVERAVAEEREQLIANATVGLIDGINNLELRVSGRMMDRTADFIREKVRLIVERAAAIRSTP